MNTISYRVLFLLALGSVLLNATGLLNDIMEPDGALYAAISKRIALTGDWVNLYGNGSDWLDKPHLPFWLAAFSMKGLGITSFAYKLPAFICFVIGILYCYQLACILYNHTIALLSVIIYATSLHVLLANFDVRAEAYLTAFMIAATYHLYKATGQKWWWQILAAAFYSALAVMTKGVFVLVTIGTGLIIWWMVTGQWRQLLAVRWYLFVLLTLLFIAPELYCLYHQFDLHPEKLVFGRKGVSGIRFFFWDSQFGRFFNNGPIQGEGDLFFFFHTTAWAFLPWSVFLYISVGRLLAGKSKGEKRHWIIWGNATAGFLLFSLSRFQLPHYIVILFPHFAMITAAYLYAVIAGNGMRALSMIQQVLYGMLVVLILLLTVVSRLPNPLVAGVLIAGITIIWVYFRGYNLQHVMVRGSLFAALLFLFLNVLFYPPLMCYQAGMLAGKELQRFSGRRAAVMFRCNNYAFEYYAPGLVHRAQTIGMVDSLCARYGHLSVFLPEEEWKILRQQYPNMRFLQQFSYYHISQLTGKFLNVSERKKLLEVYVLADLPGNL